MICDELVSSIFFSNKNFCQELFSIFFRAMSFIFSHVAPLRIRIQKEESQMKQKEKETQKLVFIYIELGSDLCCNRNLNVNLTKRNK
jgi:hypothetical protein